MFSTLEPPVVDAIDHDDPLFQLQLQVARRADEILRDEGSAMPALFAWVCAEREILTPHLGDEAGVQ